ncbi:hypothetical protein IFM89_030215 [Coptis chinensis]|uniref:RNase H type-1 domain-containing protein n=1 Tax=Coptis chinensis TaxID=261450 RepID=A0A835HND6_9MAGN|nr:hypothetical protein IFM89_030215 [Coptis chinensis]
MIRREIRAAAILITGHSLNSIADLQILKTWDLNAILPRAPRIQPCWWMPPRNGIVKINCDGSSLDNPRTTGFGATYRIASGDFLLVIWREIGVNNNYMAECLAILESVEVAIQRNWRDIWVESNSAVTIMAFGSFVVEFNNEIVSVFGGLMGKPIWVFKLDRSVMKWVKLETLGDHVLFLSHTTSILVLAAGLKGIENRIYFPRFHGKDNAYYSLSTGSYHCFGSKYSCEEWLTTSENWNCTWFQSNN